MDTRGYGGKPLHKSANVYTNDPDQPIVTLAISGRVTRFADIRPRVISLRGYAGDAIQRRVAIRPTAEHPFRITGVKAKDGRFIRLALAPQGGGELPGYVLTVENTRTDKGTYQDTVTLQTDSRERPQIDLPVYGFVRSRPQAAKKSTAK